MSRQSTATRASRAGLDVGDDGDLTRQVALSLAVVVLADLAVVGGVAALVGPWLVPLGAGVADAVGVAVPAAVGWGLLVAGGLVAMVVGQARYARLEALGEAGVGGGDADATPPDDLVARVTRLSAGIDLAPPTVAVADSPVANAFVVDGLGEATLVVSTGLLDALDGAELDAVLGHELAHLKNRDALVLTLASFLPALVGDGYSIRRDLLPFDRAGGTALLVAGAAVLVAGAAALPGVDAVTAVAAVALTLVLGAVGLGLVTAPVVVMARRLSRTREFIADRAGALAAGDPAAMASALARLDERAPAAPDADLRAAAGDGGRGARADDRSRSTVRALCLLPHGFGPKAGGADGRDRERGTFDVRAHPPTSERIDRLRRLAAALESS